MAIQNPSSCRTLQEEDGTEGQGRPRKHTVPRSALQAVAGGGVSRQKRLSKRMLKKLLLKCRPKPLQVSTQLDLVVLLHPVVKRSTICWTCPHMWSLSLRSWKVLEVMHFWWQKTWVWMHWWMLALLPDWNCWWRESRSTCSLWGHMRQGSFSGLVNRPMAPSVDSLQRRSCPSLEGGNDGGFSWRSSTQRWQFPPRCELNFSLKHQA